jgi:hypothetical protein
MEESAMGIAMRMMMRRAAHRRAISQAVRKLAIESEVS